MMTETSRYTPGSAAAAAPDPPGDDVRRSVRLRQQAVARLRAMNCMHAMHAWDRRYRDPLAAYGLAFLYAQPDRRGGVALHAATKLWLAGAEVFDLPRLLHRF